MPLVAREMPDVELSFVGDGEARQVLQKTALELGVNARVRFIGRRPHGELRTFMNAADVLVLPSHAEGIPNVLLEAMACGCPVVATRVGGIAEIVPDECGELIAVRQPAALARAICNVIGRPRDRERIRAAVAGKSWGHSGALLGAVLQAAIDQARARRPAQGLGH